MRRRSSTLWMMGTTIVLSAGCGSKGTSGGDPAGGGVALNTGGMTSSGGLVNSAGDEPGGAPASGTGGTQGGAGGAGETPAGAGHGGQPLNPAGAGGVGGAAGGPGCGGCEIDGVCFPDGSPDPENPCRLCDAGVSSRRWTNGDGAPCDDGEFCNGTDHCAGGTCSLHADSPCDDGVACNGAETCDEQEDQCVPGTSPCPSGQSCNVTTDNCTTTCDGCFIDGSCRADGTANPSNPCQRCDPNTSEMAWSNADGAVCDDGNPCNGADECVAGGCSLHAGNPCDDGVACNGTETCDETSGECGEGTTTCSPNQICNVNDDTCDCAGCTIDDTCHPNGTPHPSDPCLRCNISTATDSWSAAENGTSCGDRNVCTDGACGCEPPWMGVNCDQCVVRVSTTGDDSAGGGSWIHAKRTVRAAVAFAAETIGLGAASSCEVWVAQGTYTPGEERTDSLQLESDVRVYGGFYGDEAARNERDWTTWTTTLSGDIGVEGDPSDNLYHVVSGADRATLDGFTITEGYANGNGIHSDGAGMVNEGASPTVANCTFMGNQGVMSGSNGGAMFNNAASPTLVDCNFVDNLAASAGAIYNWGGSSPTITRCVFTGNTTTSTHGGAVYNGADANVSIVGSEFRDNLANNNGGAVYSVSSTVSIANCYFEGNSARTGGAVYSESATTNVVGSALHQNTARSAYGGGLFSARSVLSVANCTITQNTSDGYAGGLCHVDSTASIANSILWGNTASWGEEQLYFQGTPPTITLTTVAGGCSVTGCGTEDPLFDLDGRHLTQDSPAVDSGDSAALPADTLDLDLDGNTTEPWPLDLDGNARVAGGLLDRGAYEYR